MPASNRPGRRKKELVDDGTPIAGFAASLRALREDAGNPSYRQMAEAGHLAHNVLSQADAGHRLPTEEAVVAYVRACGGDVEEWKERRRRALIAHQAVEEACNPRTGVGQREQPVPVTNDHPSAAASEPAAGQLAGAGGAQEPPPLPHPDQAGQVRARPRPRRVRRSRIVYGAACVGVAVLVAVGLSMPMWRADPAEPVLPGTNGAQSAVPSAGTQVSGPGGEEQGRTCRPQWEGVSAALAEFRPCITPHAEGLSLSAEVRLMDPHSEPVQVTVWLWLMELDPQILASAEYDRTRDEATLRSCRLNLSGGQVQECGPELVVPPGEGRYSTSGSIRLHEGDHPPGWDDPGFAGTQSEAVTWPAEPQVEQANTN
ncbi:helix-turn-helix domain-containing protein (plasmid) [Nocardiopsis flavescens]|nr:helix-turn-helix domain-containing protein [Nocardiopsis flavescens]